MSSSQSSACAMHARHIDARTIAVSTMRTISDVLLSLGQTRFGEEIKLTTSAAGSKGRAAPPFADLAVYCRASLLFDDYVRAQQNRPGMVRFNAFAVFSSLASELVYCSCTTRSARLQ